MILKAKYSSKKLFFNCVLGYLFILMCLQLCFKICARLVLIVFCTFQINPFSVFIYQESLQISGEYL